MNIDEIRQVAAIVNDYALESIELSLDNFSLKIKRPAPVSAAAPRPGPGQPPPEKTEKTAEPPGAVVVSPIVGVFYSAPAPGAEPFVRIGGRVKKGDTLCIVEAMKMMNEITAESDGEIGEIMAFDGQVVEYGQPLMRLIGEAAE